MMQRLRKWMLGRPGKRMPLMDPPLRAPGQGLAERLSELFVDLLVKVVLLLTVLGGALVWAGHNFPHEPRPLGVLLVLSVYLLPSLILVIPMWLLAWRDLKQLRCLNLGLLAERVVGQQLERSRALGYSVFDDIERTGRNGRVFNIDHIAVGPGGVFVVETKARSKPERGECNLGLAGDRLTFSDGGYAAEPIVQVQANCDDVRRLIVEVIDKSGNADLAAAKKDMPIRPVIVYPGWFIEFKQFRSAAFGVTNEKTLLNHLKDSRATLSREQAKALGDLLGTHLRELRRELIDY